MRILGLTGDIACGKSTVAHLLQSQGAQALDSDLLVREIYAARDFAARVQTLFDSPILDENGRIDRAKLGSVVFDDAQGLRNLENLVFPEVAKLRESQLSELKKQGHNVAVVEAVKLLESGQGKGCDEVWCVVCAPRVQLERLMKNRGLSEAQALARQRSQPSRAAKSELAGQTPLIWIENDGTLTELAAQVAQQWKRFLA